MSQFSGDDSPPPTQGFSQNVNLDVGIETPQGLNLVSRTLSLAGSANLHLRGTAAQPVVLGRLNLSGGDLIFSGNRYKLQGGTIEVTSKLGKGTKFVMILPQGDYGAPKGSGN